jgi:hypothetical protein
MIYVTNPFMKEQTKKYEHEDIEQATLVLSRIS